MKKLICAAALLLLATAGQASTLYVLSDVSNFLTFSPDPAPVANCTGCGVGTAFVDNLGNITLTGISWSYSDIAGNAYDIAFNGTTTLATGTSLSKGPGAVCIDYSGVNCNPTGWLSSLGVNNFYTGIGSDGTTVCKNNRCRVDVSQSGSTLEIDIKRGLSESATSANSQTYVLTFTAVPIPGAAWLMGSALGLLGFARRATGTQSN